MIAKGCQSRPAEVVAGSACDRDSSELADQLAPWSTPHLRRRLESLFGVIADPEAVKRDELLQLLIREYNARGPRVVLKILSSCFIMFLPMLLSATDTPARGNSS